MVMLNWFSISLFSSSRCQRPDRTPGTALRKFLVVCLAGLTPLSGCAGISDVDELSYLNEPEQTTHYLDHSVEIAYPHVQTAQSPDVSLSFEPRTVLDLHKATIRDMTLEECVHAGLMNNRVLRSKGAYLSAGNSILSNPDRTATYYDPAIQASGVLFGSRGVEAALAAYDAQFQVDANWGRNEQIQNSPFTGGNVGSTLSRETARFNSAITKSFGYGGQFALTHNVDYQLNNVNPANRGFGSVYTGFTRASYQHPLLAGSGTEFTQIAGPIGQSFGGLSGVTQGVVIARINQDLSLTELESNVNDLVKDIEDAYWELYLQYRIYDTIVAARNSSLRTWRDAKRKLDIGGVPGFNVEDEAQARDQYFNQKALSQRTLSELYKTESALRRLLAMPVNDGTIIRPSDEPVTAMLQPEWAHSVAEALTHRVEIRRHKWNIKSLELQQRAAQNLVRPRLDFVASYDINGFGDKLLSYDDRPLGSLYGNMTDGQQTGWGLGFTFQLPIGLRQAKTQLLNIELRMAKARDVLHAQELEIAHEVGNAFQDLAEKYVTAQTYFNRRKAAKDRVELFQKKLEAGTQTLDLVLRAQSSLADAEVEYFRSLVSYNRAILNLYYRTGTLLHTNNVSMAEQDWDCEAYIDAYRRAKARTNAFDAEHLLHAEPTPFAEQSPFWNNGQFDPQQEAILATPLTTEPAMLPAPDASEPDAVSPRRDDEATLPNAPAPALQDAPAAPALPDAPTLQLPGPEKLPAPEPEEAIRAKPVGDAMLPPGPAPALQPGRVPRVAQRNVVAAPRVLDRSRQPAPTRSVSKSQVAAPSPLKLEQPPTLLPPPASNPPAGLPLVPAADDSTDVAFPGAVAESPAQSEFQQASHEKPGNSPKRKRFTVTAVTTSAPEAKPNSSTR